MNKISYPQLVKDIADAYRNAIGSTDSITIGELANKVGEAISRGNSIHYKSITYNEDNTITLIDNDDIEHTMTCVYEDNKITAITLDDEEIKLSYDSDNLIAVEDTVVNFDSILSGGSEDSEDEEIKIEKIPFDFNCSSRAGNGSSFTVSDSTVLIKSNAGFTFGYVNFNCEGGMDQNISSIFSSLPVVPLENNVVFSFDVTSFQSPSNLSWYCVVGNSYHKVSCEITGNGSYSFTLPSSPSDTYFGVRFVFPNSISSPLTFVDPNILYSSSLNNKESILP
jgi:hypothetical protein